jgi:branched-subunit amino acid transport protein AzlD
MSKTTYTLLIIAVISIVTILIRFLPFAVFRKRTPKAVLYLGNVFPYAIMSMLVVYCLRNISFTGSTHGIPEILALLTVVILHKWKHNTLLSIVAGTAVYMLLIQMVF